MKNKPMSEEVLFQELYGNYYRTAAAILAQACKKDGITKDALRDIVEDMAFGGAGSDLGRRMQQDWFLLYRDPKDNKRLHTPIQHAPEMPQTTLEKRWLAAVLRDPRVQLFCDGEISLPDEEPLFSPELFVCYDRYADGDPFTDPDYIRRFRTVRKALREHRRLHIGYATASGSELNLDVVPFRLEYSEKDDKFRLFTCDGRTLNLSRIRACALGDVAPEECRTEPTFEAGELALTVTDRNNALERVLLHFTDLRKKTVKLDENRYRVRMEYRTADETEILIRVLSFGNAVFVEEPAAFVDRIKARLAAQRSLFSAES